jgi:hypothetical protein
MFFRPPPAAVKLSPCVMATSGDSTSSQGALPAASRSEAGAPPQENGAYWLI